MSHPNIRFLDRAKETTTTTGSGTISLGGAVAGFVGVSGIGNGNSTYYTLQEGNNFEIGIGTYATAGNTLSRDEVFSSSNSDDSKIALAGSTTVFITYPADKAVVKTSGNYVGIGIDPEYQLQVSGTGSFNTVRWADGTTQTTADTDTTYTAGTGLTLVGTEFNTSGTGHFDYLGIGTGALTPTYALDVAGDAGFNEYIYHNGDGNTFIRFAPDLINLVAGSWSAIKLEKSTGKIQLNNTNRDLDVQLMAEDGEVILHTDAATNQVGIGTAEPSYTLEVSGTGSFNTVRWADGTTQITSATGDISTVSGLTVTNATNIASTGATNAASIATNTASISTNTTNIASTGATNASDINTVSGLLYDYWTVTDGDNSENISTTDSVKFTGDGATTVAYNTANNTFTINTPSAETSYDYWTATDGSTNSNISNSNTVRLTGAGNTTVSLSSGSPNVYTVSGSDTTYTAGTGLSLDGTQFNVSGIDSTMIVDGSVLNADLANSSITINAGTGLSNGGSVSLGASISIDAHTGSTSASGIVRLQDSATDGTTDRAITPNAVYDISGVLSTSIASTGATNASSIATNTSNISTNTTNIASTGATNGALIATNTTNIATNVTNIASTGATNAAAIAAKDNYQYWTATDGDATSNISTTEDVKITGAGQVTVSLVSGSPNVFTVSGAAAAAGAPTDAQYVTLALDGDLSAERVLAASTGVHIVDGGANGNVTVSVSGSTTSQLGIVQLQDSATDGTTDKAITPNAVYDISGVLSTSIASTGSTNAASIATNTSNISTNTTNIASTGATNAAAILANTSNISTNTTNIASTGATNAAAAATNATNISTNATNISTNTTNIASTGATNAAAILANTSNISTNTTNIASTGATNAAAAATNATNISTNATNISTNTTNIASTGASNLSLIRSYIDTSDNATFNNLTAQGNLTVSGTLTYLDSTTVTIADKQLELASNSGTPIGNDSAVNDGGIVVKSTDGDKKWTWLDATDAWTSTENISLNSSKKIIFGDSTEQTTSPTGDISTVSGLLYDYWTLRGDSRYNYQCGYY